MENNLNEKYAELRDSIGRGDIQMSREAYLAQEQEWADIYGEEAVNEAKAQYVQTRIDAVHDLTASSPALQNVIASNAKEFKETVERYTDAFRWDEQDVAASPAEVAENRWNELESITLQDISQTSIPVTEEYIVHEYEHAYANHFDRNCVSYAIDKESAKAAYDKMHDDWEAAAIAEQKERSRNRNDVERD